MRQVNDNERTVVDLLALQTDRVPASTGGDVGRVDTDFDLPVTCADEPGTLRRGLVDVVDISARRVVCLDNISQSLGKLIGGWR